MYTERQIKRFLALDACSESRTWLDLSKPLEEIYATCPRVDWLVYLLTLGFARAVNAFDADVIQWLADRGYVRGETRRFAVWRWDGQVGDIAAFRALVPFERARRFIDLVPVANHNYDLTALGVA